MMRRAGHFILCGIIFLCVIHHHAWAGEKQKNLQYYQACRQDSDCVVMEGICGPEAINKERQKEREEFNRQNAPYVECMPPAVYRMRGAACHEGSCVIKPFSRKP